VECSEYHTVKGFQWFCLVKYYTVTKLRNCTWKHIKSNTLAFYFRSVPSKTLAGMQWASDNLKDNDYYSSCDDDMMVNLGALQESIDVYNTEKLLHNWPEFPIICGYEYWNDTKHPIRDKDDKNYVSFEKYGWPDWPHFCLGGLYTTSVRVVKKLFEISRTQPILNTDDVWITGILRNVLGMPSSMLIKPDPVAATHNLHYEGFSRNRLKIRLINEWYKTFHKFKHKSICKC